MGYVGRVLLALPFAFAMGCGPGEERPTIGCYRDINIRLGIRKFCYDRRRAPERTFSDFYDDRPDGDLDLFCLIGDPYKPEAECTWIVDSRARQRLVINSGEGIVMRHSPEADDAQKAFDALKAEAK